VSFVFDDCDEAVVIGAAGGAPAHMCADLVEPIGGCVPDQFGFDVAL
jgi:hypothetical protein